MVLRLLIGTAVVLCLAGSASAADGAAVYSGQCAKCHGDTGKSDTTIGKAVKAPALAGDAKLQQASEGDIAALIKGNKKHPPTVKSLSDDDLRAAATFIKGLAGK